MNCVPKLIRAPQMFFWQSTLKSVPLNIFFLYQLTKRVPPIDTNTIIIKFLELIIIAPYNNINLYRPMST